MKLPGDDFYPGLWPAVWMMGNLGRAGYMETTSGFWPYSYSTCQGSTANGWSDLPPQLISACASKTVNRTKWDMKKGTGRGAPEIDIMEARSVGCQPCAAAVGCLREVGLPRRAAAPAAPQGPTRQRRDSERPWPQLSAGSGLSDSADGPIDAARNGLRRGRHSVPGYAALVAGSALGQEPVDDPPHPPLTACRVKHQV